MTEPIINLISDVYYNHEYYLSKESNTERIVIGDEYTKNWLFSNSSPQYVRILSKIVDNKYIKAICLSSGKLQYGSYEKKCKICLASGDYKSAKITINKNDYYACNSCAFNIKNVETHSVFKGKYYNKKPPKKHVTCIKSLKILEGFSVSYYFGIYDQNLLPKILIYQTIGPFSLEKELGFSNFTLNFGEKFIKIDFEKCGLYIFQSKGEKFDPSSLYPRLMLNNVAAVKVKDNEGNLYCPICRNTMTEFKILCNNCMNLSKLAYLFQNTEKYWLMRQLSHFLNVYDVILYIIEIYILNFGNNSQKQQTTCNCITHCKLCSGCKNKCECESRNYQY